MSATLVRLLGSFAVAALVGCGSTPKAPAGEARGAVLEGEAAASALGEALPPQAVQRFDQAVVRMNAGDLAAAEQEFNSLAAAYPSYAGALTNLGILQLKASRLDDAEKSLLEAAKRNDASAIAFNQLGIVQRRLGQFREAEKSYQRAVELDANYALAWLNLGVLHDLYLQQPERALDAFERYLALTGAADKKVVGWVAELKRRIDAEPRAARSEP